MRGIVYISVLCLQLISISANAQGLCKDLFRAKSKPVVLVSGDLKTLRTNPYFEDFFKEAKTEKQFKEDVLAMVEGSNLMIDSLVQMITAMENKQLSNKVLSEFKKNISEISVQLIQSYNFTREGFLLIVEKRYEESLRKNDNLEKYLKNKQSYIGFLRPRLDEPSLPAEKRVIGFGRRFSSGDSDVQKNPIGFRLFEKVLEDQDSNKVTTEEETTNLVKPSRPIGFLHQEETLLEKSKAHFRITMDFETGYFDLEWEYQVN